MLTAFITKTVDLSRVYALAIIASVIALSLVMTVYVAGHFKINTDINQLLASDLPFRRHEAEIDKAFPQKADNLIIVVDADTADNAEYAATLLAAKLKSLPQQFSFVSRPDDIPFFRKNGLLFLSRDELGRTLQDLVKAQPLLGALAGDPSLRGLFSTVRLMTQGALHGAVDYKDLDKPFDAIASALESDTLGNYKPLAWQSLMSSAPPNPGDLRKIIITKPTLDYTALEPGKAASDAVRTAVSALNLTANTGVSVRLTGPVPLNDEEFASVTAGAKTATLLSAFLVAVILWLALRSWRLIIPILISLAAGLAITTGIALMTVRSLNLISVAFAVMFIGIAVDFGIQFGVRYRAQRFREPDHAKAMTRASRIVGLPLAMAAASTTLGFLSFMPTAYRGVSELGFIAGIGMIVAFVLTITFLPALFAVFNPPPEKEAVGFRWLAPLDRILAKNRYAILILASLAAIAGLGVCKELRFDFDPLDLKDPKAPSVSTLFDLMKDPLFSPYTIAILSPDLAHAGDLEAKLQTAPEVDHTMSLLSFVPQEQDAKLMMIADARNLLEASFNPLSTQRAPDDDEILNVLNQTSILLHQLGPNHSSAERLATSLDYIVSRHSHSLIQHVHQDIINVILMRLADVREALKAERVTLDSITPDLKSDWIAADGKALVEVYPKGNARQPGVLDAFAEAVQKIAPDASGPTISIRESGRTITGAFIQAGFYAIVAIMLLALFMLRSIRDVMILMLPLLLAGILTLATMVVIGIPLNFANIIALPLLLSLGVSYAIYFVSYHKSGQKDPLQSSMARAVLFSASTALVAFGSLGLSSHPGTSSMGKLLTVALLYSLTCTFFVLPALLGQPKADKHSSK